MKKIRLLLALLVASIGSNKKNLKLQNYSLFSFAVCKKMSNFATIVDNKRKDDL